MFSSTTTTSTGLFGANDNKPLFGATSTTPALGGKFNFYFVVIIFNLNILYVLIIMLKNITISTNLLNKNCDWFK